MPDSLPKKYAPELLINAFKSYSPLIERLGNEIRNEFGQAGFTFDRVEGVVLREPEGIMCFWEPDSIEQKKQADTKRARYYLRSYTWRIKRDKTETFLMLCENIYSGEAGFIIAEPRWTFGGLDLPDKMLESDLRALMRQCIDHIISVERREIDPLDD